MPNYIVKIDKLLDQLRRRRATVEHAIISLDSVKKQRGRPPKWLAAARRLVTGDDVASLDVGELNAE